MEKARGRDVVNKGKGPWKENKATSLAGNNQEVGLGESKQVSWDWEGIK